MEKLVYIIISLYFLYFSGNILYDLLLRKKPDTEEEDDDFSSDLPEKVDGPKDINEMVLATELYSKKPSGLNGNITHLNETSPPEVIAQVESIPSEQKEKEDQFLHRKVPEIETIEAFLEKKQLQWQSFLTSPNLNVLTETSEGTRIISAT